MEYQVQLQRNMNDNAKLAQADRGSPLPPFDQRRSVKSEARHVKAEKGTKAQSTEAVYVK